MKNSIIHRDVAVVVSTYNRKKLLMECLNSIINQKVKPAKIYIVDGPSTDGTKESVISFINKPKINKSRMYTRYIGKKNDIFIEYVRFKEDVGGAWQFYEGMKLAYTNGYKWIWLMDDDAEPEKECLANLMRYTNLPNISALIPIGSNYVYGVKRITPKNRYLKFVNGQQEYIKVDTTSFVGPLISRRVIRKIGFPKKEFFIWWDDIEYSFRMRKVGNLYVIRDARIKHKVEKNVNVKEFFGHIWVSTDYKKFWKSYLGFRNRAYTIKKHKGKLWPIYVLYKYAKMLVGILLFDDHKIKRIYYMTKAFIDGIFERFDNKKIKMIKF